MPFAVTHILVPIILVALFRDIFVKDKKKFPLHYVLLAGLGGALPDIDIPISIFLKFLGSASWNIHRTFTHSIYFPLIFFALFLILIPIKEKAKICNLTRHKLKLNLICLMLGIGIILHIFLDFIFGKIPFPSELNGYMMPTLDGILLVIWIIYLELKHKISDFI